MTLLESLHERWANLRLWIRLLLITALLAAAGLFIARPAYLALKTWRLGANLQAAKTAVNEQRMNEARDLSLTVLRSGDPGIEAYRILEKSMAALRDPRHSDVARALLSHPGGSEADRLAGFRGFAPGAPLGLLGQAWVSLSDESHRNPEFALIFADRLIAAKRLHEAAPVLLAVPENQRTPAVRQRLAKVLILSGKREGFAEAQRMISRFWLAEPSSRAAWWDLLETIPAESLDPTLLRPVRDDLSAGKPANPRAALTLIRLDYAAHPANRNHILREAVSSWKSPAPADLARLLSQLGLHSLLLDTFPPASSAAANPELLPFIIDSLVRSRRWQELPPLLAAHGELLPRPTMLCIMALAAAGTGDSSALAEHWNTAVNEAASSADSGALLTLYQFATTHGMTPEAEQALVEAILTGRGPLPLYSDIRPLLISLASRERENQLLRICAIYLLFEPGNPVLLTQYAYLACLNDLADPSTVIEAATPLAKTFPDSIPIQCMLATACLAAGRPEHAARALAPLQTDPSTLAPGFRAVFLTTRALNGTLPPDDPSITSLPWQDMLPSERRKFSAWLKQPPAPALPHTAAE